MQVGTAHSPCLVHHSRYGRPGWGTSPDKPPYESNYVLCIMTPAPTAAPTRLPTFSPTPLPTTASPTANPTMAPTYHPCFTSNHGCDTISTYCANITTPPLYACVCRQGFIQIPGESYRCDPAPAPTSAPTASTVSPTSAPSQHPCGTQLHGSGALSVLLQYSVSYA